MDNGFDYMNIPDFPEEDKPAQQPQAEPAPVDAQPVQEQPVQEQPAQVYTYTPTRESVPVQPAPVPAPKKKRSGKGLVIAISIVAAVLLLMNLVMLTVASNLQDSVQSQKDRNDKLLDRIEQLEDQMENGGVVQQPSNSGQAATPEGLLTPQQVYAMNVDAVVAVSSQAIQTNIYGQVSKTASMGSGFIISADGLVVTNYHVIEGANQISIITANEEEHEATVVGYDKTNDVALLRAEGSNFDFVTLGSSDALQVGDQVMAIGNPLGELTSTLTVGYVSAKDRMVSTDGTAINMLQTDAAINSGNSGGPLFNAKGEVVGINTAKYSGTSSSGASIEGIGFAIPIDDVAGILDDLANQGYVSSTYLGVSVKEVDSSVQSFGLPAGVYVEEVIAGYCAEEAGVQAKDIIIAVGDYKVDSFSALSRALRRFEPGDKTTITVYRAGQELILDIVLDERPQDVEASVPDTEEPTEEQSRYPNIWDYFFPGG